MCVEVIVKSACTNLSSVFTIYNKLVPVMRMIYCRYYEIECTQIVSKPMLNNAVRPKCRMGFVRVLFVQMIYCDKTCVIFEVLILFAATLHRLACIRIAVRYNDTRPSAIVLLILQLSTFRCQKDNPPKAD